MSAVTSRHSKPVRPASAEIDSPSAKNESHPVNDLVEYAIAYSREKPEIAALWCLGIGFVFGWKFKLW